MVMGYKQIGWDLGQALLSPQLLTYPSHPVTKAFELIMTTRSGHFLMHYNIKNIIFNFKLRMSSPVLGCPRMAKC